MRVDQQLSETLTRLLASISKLIRSVRPDAVVAQGDTSTVLAASMSATLNTTPFLHVEAGLRSGDIQHPFPEEYYRKCISSGAALHLAPTNESRNNLILEGIPDRTIKVVGNTIIDMVKRIDEQGLEFSNDKIVLITIHRRENHGERLLNALNSIVELSHSYLEYKFIFPLHPNPNVNAVVRHTLRGRSNISLIPSLNYIELLKLIKNATLIMTDSGGIQEEATYFSRPVLVLRDKTERIEAVRAGASILVGCDKTMILKNARKYLDAGYSRSTRKNSKFIYGNGNSSERIVMEIREFFDSLSPIAESTD